MQTAANAGSRSINAAPGAEIIGSSPAWRNFAAVLFSFPNLCLVMLSGVVFAFCARAIAEPDIWWHLRNAQYLLVHHALPRVDMYSFGAAGSPWIDHEWLSELLFYFGFRWTGLQGLLVVYLAASWLLFACVYRRTCNAGADCKNATVVTLLAIFLGVVSIGPRMLLFGWLWLVVLLMVLDEFRRSGRGLWMLPPLFAIWINLHGSWIFGIAVLGLTLLSGLVEGDWGVVSARRWSSSQLRKLVLALLASLAALFVNPFGYRLALYPFDLLLRQPANLQHIQEWQSVDFSTGNGKLALVMILAVLAAALFSSRRWRLDEVLLTAFALWGALSHTRLLFFAGLVLPPILGPRLKLFPPYDRTIDKPWLNAAIIAAVAGGLLYFFPTESALQQKVGAQYPEAAIHYMQQHQLNGRIFNVHMWGGYMEWYAPDLKPFIDGRTDIFVYNGTFDDYVRAVRIQQPFEILDKYKIDYVLFEKNTPFTYLLSHSSGWRELYSDDVAVIYQRAPSHAVGGNSYGE